MGLLWSLLTAPVMVPVKSLEFIFDKITQQVNEEMLDEGRVRRQLLELQSLLDAGEISEDEFYETEEELLDWLDAILYYKETLAEQGDE